MASVEQTLGDPSWIVENFIKVRNVFPTETTLVTQERMMRWGFQFKLLGIDWRSPNEMSQAMVLCRHLGMFDQAVQGGCIWVVRSPRSTPPAAFFDMTEAQVEVNRLLRTEPPAQIQDLALELLHRIMYRRP